MKRAFINHIRYNLKEYISVTLIFVIGIIIGVISINHSSDEQLTEITNYITEFINNLKENGFIDIKTLFIKNFLSNIYIILIMWFIGLAVIGTPIIYGIIGYKGFGFGYTISAIVASLGLKNGLIASLIIILIKNIIYIPCLFGIAVSGIKLYKSIIKDRDRENIKFEIIRHTIFCAILGIVIIITSFINSYLSNCLIKLFVKYI